MYRSICSALHSRHPSLCIFESESGFKILFKNKAVNQIHAYTNKMHLWQSNLLSSKMS